MAFNFEMRYATDPEDAKKYDTTEIRKRYLIENLLVPGDINMIYSQHDRMVTVGIMPSGHPIDLPNHPEFRAEYMLERREMGVINVGGPGKISLDDAPHSIDFKEALYIGRGTKKVTFESKNSENPAKFYILSCPAHKAYPSKKITQDMADPMTIGSQETSNHRTILKFIIPGVVETCQLAMGMTSLKPGSVWNTMPSHVHDRRMEMYFYFEVPEGQRVCHFMGQPQETRHIWMANEQAVVSPTWSIHSGAGTSNYSFIWGMAGENLDYTDMDACPTETLL